MQYDVFFGDTLITPAKPCTPLNTGQSSIPIHVACTAIVHLPVVPVKSGNCKIKPELLQIKTSARHWLEYAMMHPPTVKTKNEPSGYLRQDASAEAADQELAESYLNTLIDEIVAKGRDAAISGSYALAGTMQKINIYQTFPWATLIKYPHLQMTGVPNEIRTRVTAVKGRCPRPLDDRDVVLLVEVSGIEPLTSCMPCKRSPS